MASKKVLKKAKKSKAKMSPRKVVKFPAKPVKFNKKSLEAFCDLVFNPKTGKYLRMCKGTLQNGPDGEAMGRTMHCVLGDMKDYFISRKPLVRNENDCWSLTENGEEYGETDIGKDLAKGNYSIASALADLPSINDRSSTFSVRAKRVRDHLIENVLPLLSK